MGFFPHLFHIPSTSSPHFQCLEGDLHVKLTTRSILRHDQKINTAIVQRQLEACFELHVYKARLRIKKDLHHHKRRDKTRKKAAAFTLFQVA